MPVNAALDDYKNSISKLTSFLDGIVPTDMLSDTRLFRIGLSSQIQQKPRPLKIVCVSEEKSRALHRSLLNAKKSGRHVNLQNVWLSFDRTRAQQEELAVLKTQIQDRRQKGEMNIKISYRQGCPVITHVQNVPAVNKK